MDFEWKRYSLYFLIGGLLTTTIVGLEEFGSTTLSRLAALFPVFTWLAYLIIGQFGTGQQISQHAKFVLIGTIFCWIPYMMAIIYFSPKIGVHKAVFSAIGIFIVLAMVFTYVYYHI